MNTDQTLDYTGTPGQSPQNQMRQPTGSIREVAEQTGQQLKQKASEATHELKERGADALDQVRTQAQEMADRQKDQLLNRLSHCGNATRRAAEQLRADNDPAMAGYVDALASRLDRGADYFRNRDYRGLLSDTEDFARRRPELFFGGLFIAGLALARFMKASTRREIEDEPRMDYGGEEMPASLVHVHENQFASSPMQRPQPAENLAFGGPGTSPTPGCGC